MGIIGISGYARSGKDTVADILVAKYGYTKISFADKLREALYALNPIVSTGDQMIYDHEPKYARLRYVINIYGWDGYKESNWAYEIRQLLQRFGTEVGREILGEDVWVNAIEEELYDNVVIPDCRYPNEAAFIQDLGSLWRVDRPGVMPANSHISETALDYWEFDEVIRNDGTIEELEEKVAKLV